MAVQGEWLQTDFYAVLGVAETAADAEVKRAYRRLARQLHPDANPGDAEAELRFKDVSAAYHVLGNAERRAEYDRLRRRMGSSGRSPGADPRRGGAGAGGGGVEDLLDDLAGVWPGRGGASGRPRRGRDLDAEVVLSFEAAVLGSVQELEVLADLACPTCAGTGARPGGRVLRCPRCGGVGLLDQSFGPFSLRRPCWDCGGQGVVVRDPCPQCGGRGSVRRPERVRVRVPAGVDDGQRIRVAGRGAPGMAGGPPGDLVLGVRVAPHDRFRRDGPDLLVTVPVTYPEAALGAAVVVADVAGRPVTVDVPPGTASGSRIRVPGHGVATSTRTGDLVATVEVVVPPGVAGAELDALRALADAIAWDPRAGHGVAGADGDANGTRGRTVPGAGGGTADAPVVPAGVGVAALGAAVVAVVALALGVGSAVALVLGLLAGLVALAAARR